MQLASITGNDIGIDSNEVARGFSLSMNLHPLANLFSYFLLLFVDISFPVISIAFLDSHEYIMLTLWALMYLGMKPVWITSI